MLNELTLTKQSNPDEIFSSYYADVLEVAKKKSIAYDSKEKPLFTNTFNYDEGDKIVFCIVTDELKIFAKPIQVSIGSYFTNNEVDYLRVDEILFQIKENYYADKATVEISSGSRTVVRGDEVPLIRIGLIIKGVINNGRLHLIWDAMLNDKIRFWFYRNERDKQIEKQADVELDFKKPGDDDKEEDDIDFLNPDTSPEVKINSMNSKNSFNKWFKKRFPKTANLNTTPLMETYVKTITKHNKYY
jgi:hypothetical protein